MRKQQPTLIPDALFDLAFAYKKTKLWKRLWDLQLFAVKMTDGEIGYCCVLGMNGEHVALAVHVGQAGLSSFRSIAKGPSFVVTDEYGNEVPSFQLHELLMGQNCIQCAFENKADMRERSVDAAKNYTSRHNLKLAGQRAYPDFVRYSPQHYPWYVQNDKDQEYIAQALSAAIEVSRRLEETIAQGSGRAAEKLGFTEGSPYNRKIPLLEKSVAGYTWSDIELPDEVCLTYPTPAINDVQLARIRKSKKSTKDWYCDIFMFSSPVSDEDCGDADASTEPIEAPYFPYLLLVVESGEGLILEQTMLPALDEKCCFDMVSSLTDTIVKIGKPRKLLVRPGDERTQAILSAFARQINVNISEFEEDDSTLIDTEMELFEHFSNGFNGSEDEMIGDLVAQLSQLSDDELRSMPDDMRSIMLEAVYSGRIGMAFGKRLIRVLGGK